VEIGELTSPIPDPVTLAARDLLGIGYLFPFQRLAVANILEAAGAADVALRWPAGTAATAARDDEDSDAFPEGLPEAAAAEETGDRTATGRQIVILPTGAGKSLCFQLPALLMDRPTLVLYPILSLMADQQRRLSALGFTPVVLRGGQSRQERETIWDQIASGKSRFIIANPEVLLTPTVMARLASLRIAHVVVDEAHCVSEWGESFRPAYLRVAEIIAAAGAPLITAFTATASPEVLEKIQHYIFGDSGAHRIIGNPDRPNIDYAAQGAILRDLAVRDLLRRLPRPAIVFCSSRIRTERLARYLQGELKEPEVRFYHAGLERDEKKDVEAWFFSSPGGILTATCAYGLGVDKSDIRTVIHRDCPPSVEAYLQESGRAGRDGKPAQAVLLWGPDDEAARQRIAPGPDRERFDRLLAYGRNIDGCRRAALLGLLGYEGGGCVPGDVSCDVCRGTARPDLREQRSLVSFIARNRRRYTLGAAAGTLARSTTLDCTEEDGRRALAHLVDRGLLKKSTHPFWKQRLTLGSGGGSFAGGGTPGRAAPRSPLFFDFQLFRRGFFLFRFGRTLGPGRKKSLPPRTVQTGDVENQEKIGDQDQGNRDHLP